MRLSRRGAYHQHSKPWTAVALAAAFGCCTCRFPEEKRQLGLPQSKDEVELRISAVVQGLSLLHSGNVGRNAGGRLALVACSNE